MKILIVSGFLGAGKTTFIRSLRQKTNIDFVIYENEYAEVNVDSVILETNDLLVWESTENCACCSGKGDFASSILTISNTLDPEFLIVEPTGVAMLSNMINNIKNICYEKISLLAPVTLVDTTRFFKLYDNYTSLINNQIDNAQNIIFTKTEYVNTDEINLIENIIRENNGKANIITTGFLDKDKDFFMNFLTLSLDGNKIDIKEEFNENNFETFTIKNPILICEVELIYILDLMVGGAFGNIERAKGVVKCANQYLRFDLVGTLYSITGTVECESAFVTIGKNINKSALYSCFLDYYNDKNTFSKSLFFKRNMNETKDL